MDKKKEILRQTKELGIIKEELINFQDYDKFESHFLDTPHSLFNTSADSANNSNDITEASRCPRFLALSSCPRKFMKLVDLSSFLTI